MHIKDEHSTIQGPAMDAARAVEDMEYLANCSEQTAALVIIAAALRELVNEVKSKA